jgi:GT2 family glycosyltransferase
MKSFKNRIAFIIATKDRPEQMADLLKSLDSLTYKPDQIVVVDGSSRPIDPVLRSFPDLKPDYVRCFPPSLTKQRNAGLKAIQKEMTLIGFLDDDAVLESRSLEHMMDFWENEGKDAGGASFNMVNYPPLYAFRLKSLPMVRRMGFYSSEQGRVLPSGFHTMIGYVKKNIRVDWLPNGACVWRREIFDRFRFDEWFLNYGYLEDLDFSYRVGLEYPLYVVSRAEYHHFPVAGGRLNEFRFGRQEVKNRLYFVRKHRKLSVLKCTGALLTRAFMSFFLFVRQGNSGYLKRVMGNISGFLG